MATQYIKYDKSAKKCFFPNYRGGDMVPFGQGVATAMLIIIVSFFLKTRHNLISKIVIKS